MNLYVETSAVVGWLLDEERGDGARAQFAAADIIFTSDLTLIECDRAFRGAAAPARVTARDALQLHAVIDTALAHWTLQGMDADIVHRSRRSFPCEPILTLDAIHLATALAVRNLSPDLLVLSPDDRTPYNAVALGFQVAHSWRRAPARLPPWSRSTKPSAAVMPTSASPIRGSPRQ